MIDSNFDITKIALGWAAPAQSFEGGADNAVVETIIIM